MDTVLSFLPLLITLISVSVILGLANWILLGKPAQLGNERRLPRQLTLLGLSLVGLIAVIIALPVDPSTRNQIIGLVSLLVSGIIAFSSTNIIANLMGGLMLRITRSFRTGDYIRVGEQFGRVTERGLFDTEIQTETRELISVPNTHLITHPHTVVRYSGTIVTASLSLGYDIHHSRIEELLVKAAFDTALTDPYVHISELGDFSITYRVGGLLTDVKTILTTRSNLHRNILDTLHEAGVEIVSPTFMNQRRLDESGKILPGRGSKHVAPTMAVAEEIAFDKAEEAEQRENRILELEKSKAALGQKIGEAEGEEKKQLEAALETVEKDLEALRTKPKKEEEI